MGVGHYALGDVEHAIESLPQRLATFRAIGNHAGVARNSWNLGVLAQEQGDLKQAVALMQVAVAFYTTIGPPDQKYQRGLERVRNRLAAHG